MAPEDFKRKLTAIFSADVVEYSRLMSADEASTVKTLTTYREIMASLIKQHRGRVIDSPGDNVLAEFASVVDATQCAVAVQKEFQSRNADLPEEKRMVFRIGINLGDVIEEEERIYGDGVNIAARLEALCDPGGICVSKTAFDQIETKLPLGYEYLGEQEVKNIAKPVGAYRVLMEPRVTVAEEVEKEKAMPVWRRKAILAGGIVALLLVIALLIWNHYLGRPPVEPASVARMAFPLPEKPSIAVLPFVNMSEDPKQEYFSDGLTEEIITALSNVPKLFVIARNSTFAYKAKSVKVQQVAEELGVRYVLEGSVRKSEDKIRVTAQLIDAVKGHHLWAEKYDRDLKDIFALQDEITKQILTAVELKLTEGEYARLWIEKPRSLKAYMKLLQANEYRLRYNKDDNVLARQLGEEAIALDPEYAAAYRAVAGTHLFDARFGWSDSPSKSMERVIELVQKALSIDDSLPAAHCMLGLVYLMKKDYEKALAEAELEIALKPNTPAVFVGLGAIMASMGRTEEAVQWVEKAIRLNPLPPPNYLTIQGLAYYLSRRYEDALAVYNKLADANPNHIVAQIYLASCYSLLGRGEGARRAAGQVLRIQPRFSLESFAMTIPFKRPSDGELLIDSLRKAGLPETPPLPLPDKPSIAVLPFENMTGDPEQEYFSDGITEEIITALSKTPKIFVIARISSFKYKGKEVDVRTVGSELGVRYVLEGSVRRSEDQLRITAQLVDAKTGNHLWAERYDRELKDIFALQDDITKEVIITLQVKLTIGEQARVYGKGTDKFEAYLRLLQGREHYRRGTKEDNILAKRIFEEVIALDPKYAVAYRFLSGTHHADLAFGTSKSPKGSIARAIELAKSAIAIDDSLAEAHGFLGVLYTLTGQYEKGIEEAERAVALDPNSADAHIQLGAVLHNAGRRDEAIPIIKRAIRLNPIAPAMYLVTLGRTYLSLGRYEEAIEACKNAVQRNPDFLFAHIILAATYSLTDKEEQARAAAKEVLRIDPKFSLDSYEKRQKKIMRDNKTEMKLFIEALRKAGLK